MWQSVFVIVAVVVAVVAVVVVVVVVVIVASEAAEVQRMSHMGFEPGNMADVRVKRGWKASVAAALIELAATAVPHKD